MGMHSLAARAVVASHDRLRESSNGFIDLQLQKGANFEIHKGGLVVIVATCIVWLLAYLHTYYTYGVMVPVLVMNEATEEAAVVVATGEYHDAADADNDNEDPDAPLLTKEEKEFMKPRDEEVVIIKHKPITSKFRTTIRHLRAQTGSKWASLHGLTGWGTYVFTAGIVSHIGRLLFPPGFEILRAPLNATTCTFFAAWIQHTVAKHDGQTSYFKLAGNMYRAGHFKMLFLSSMLVELIEYFTVWAPRFLIGVTHDSVDSLPKEYYNTVMGVGYAAAVITAVILVFGAVIPVSIGFVRFSASLLPEDVDSIIPLDRTLAGAEVKSIGTAWKSFTREGCWRLFKTYFKATVIQIALGVFFGMLVVAEIAVFRRSTDPDMLE